MPGRKKLENKPEEMKASSARDRRKFGRVLEKNFKELIIPFKPHKNIKHQVEDFDPIFSSLNSINIYKFIISYVEVNPVNSIVSIFGLEDKNNHTVYAFLYGTMNIIIPSTFF